MRPIWILPRASLPTEFFANPVKFASQGLLIVEDSIYDEFVEKSRKHRREHPGPLNLPSKAGAVSSAIQMEKDLSYIEAAIAQGAAANWSSRLLTETGGYFVQPTVFSGITQGMTLTQKEVFGPVLGIMRFSGEDEALQLANSAVYGLAFAVWTSNLSRAHRMLRGFKAGVVHVNTYSGANGPVPRGACGSRAMGMTNRCMTLKNTQT